MYPHPRKKMLIIVRVLEDFDSARPRDGPRISCHAKSQVDISTCIWRRSSFRDVTVISSVVSPVNALNTSQAQPEAMEESG